MNRTVSATAIAAQVQMTPDMAAEYVPAAEWFRWTLRNPSHTRYTDPQLRTVHEVAARALNPPTAHVEVVDNTTTGR